jgi:hypothetical protein
MIRQTGTGDRSCVTGGVVSRPEDATSRPSKKPYRTPAPRKRADRVWVVLLVFFFAVGVYLVVLQSAALPAAISAAHGRGQHGRATATDVYCGSDNAGNCVWSGDYVSTDGTTTFRNVSFQGHGWPTGKSVDALYEGQSLAGGPLIYRADERHPWIWEAVLMAFGCALVVGTPLLRVLEVRGVLK